MIDFAKVALEHSSFLPFDSCALPIECIRVGFANVALVFVKPTLNGVFIFRETKEFSVRPCGERRKVGLPRIDVQPRDARVIDGHRHITAVVVCPCPNREVRVALKCKVLGLGNTDDVGLVINRGGLCGGQQGIS